MDIKTPQYPNDIEKEKILAEIKLINARLKKDYPDKKPTRLDKVLAFIKKWSAVILGLCALIAGIWGVFIPIRTFYAERSKQLRFELNPNMIALVENIDSMGDNERIRALVMLSYYEGNSIPILLSLIGEADNAAEKDFLKEANSRIAEIYSDNSGDITGRIIAKINGSFSRLQLSEGFQTAQIHNELYNYLDLSDEIAFKKKDQDRINNCYTAIKKAMEQDSLLHQRSETYFKKVAGYLNISVE